MKAIFKETVLLAERTTATLWQLWQMWQIIFAHHTHTPENFSYLCSFIDRKDMHEGIKDIYNLLDSNRLKEAIIQLKALATQVQQWNLPARIEEAETAYGYMLQYAAQGLQDPTRNQFYNHTRRTAYELTDEVNIALDIQKAPETFYERLRTFALHPARTYAEAQMALEAYTEDIGTANLIYTDERRRQAETEKTEQAHEMVLTELFDRTWTTPHWNDIEARQAGELMQSPLVQANDQAVLVSAATLALLRTFDARKLHFLLDAYRHESLQVSQRAIVGMAIAIVKHAARIGLYPEINARLSLMAEEESFRKNLFTIQMQLIITRETTKIDRKMREEIIPEMIKNAKQLKNSRQFDEDEPTEQNPEWEEWMDQSGMSEKIKEMGEWQMAGADVYMSSFAQLKHYPFFHTMSHWFYPFDTRQPLLAPIRKNLEGSGLSPLKLIAHSPYFCNSDKYSFALAMLGMPQAMKDNTLQQMESQIAMEDGSMDKLKELAAYTPKAKDISRQYIQDLYRFFKLWRNQKEEEDIFMWNFHLWEKPYLKDIIRQELADVKHLADYLMQKGYLEEAIDLYLELEDTEANNAEMQQKIGYLSQELGEYANAINHYQRADLQQPDNLWTIKHLAQCYKMSGDTEKALEHYRKAEDMEPDNLSTAMQTGQCLLTMERYEEALRYFHKVEYLSKKPDNARRAIAWCSFLSGKHEDALKYYRKLTEQPEPKPTDWMNLGHVHLAMHHMPEAIRYYRLARENERSHSAFIRKFEADTAELLAQGLTPEDLHIVLDLLV